MNRGSNTCTLIDEPLFHEIRKIREAFLVDIPKSISLEAKSWIEDDRLLGGVGRALVVILQTLGCSWALSDVGGCSMCGYVRDAARRVVETDEIAKQFRDGLNRYLGQEFESVKIFTSGSFFDDSEVPEKAREDTMKILASIDKMSEVIVESRPEYVTREKISRCMNHLKGKILEIGIGLESSSDEVRFRCINKGFSFQDFIDATKKITESGAHVRAYILIKPPFLSEKEAIEDAVRSAIDATKVGARSVSFNPCAVHSGTLVEKLWKNKNYRPPWLWSVVEVLKRSFEAIKGGVDRIICDPVGGGKIRGPHNCGRCDKNFLKAIKETILNQNTRALNTNCDCYYVWRETMNHEMFSRDIDSDFILRF